MEVALLTQIRHCCTADGRYLTTVSDVFDLCAADRCVHAGRPAAGERTDAATEADLNRGGVVDAGGAWGIWRRDVGGGH